MPTNATPLAAAIPANFTRSSPSLLRKFTRTGRLHYIPIYWLLRLSDFAREGMDHSGSYRFADHMYRGEPSGRGWLGRWLDGMLLRLPAARSMRERCFESQRAMREAFTAHPSTPFRLLTIPCGLPRDVRDFILTLRETAPDLLARIHYSGIDIDPSVINEADAFLREAGIANANLSVGDALNPAGFPCDSLDFISSTGLGEFLDNPLLERFYRNVFAALAPGGTFFTSAAACGRDAAALLEAFELKIQYRNQGDVEAILRAIPWRSLSFSHDKIGLQTFVRAVK